MKSFLRIFLITFFFPILICFVLKKDKKTFTPPGTVKISENLFFDETEITNSHWSEYTKWIKNHFGDTSSRYLGSLPDSTVWLDSLAYNLPYMNFYFRNPAFFNYPVVGITYEQAVDYCKWRTDRVRECYDVINQKKIKEYVPKKFLYRLPSKDEWETVAKAGYDSKTMKKLGNKYKGMNKNNFRNSLPPDVTAPVYSYWPNSFGVWQILGNVAEMVSEKGIAKGGGWCQKDKDVSVEKDFNYEGPTSWIGLRCACEIIEE